MRKVMIAMAALAMTAPHLPQGFAKADMHGMFPEGIAGIRMNHNLGVRVSDFKAENLK